MYSIYVHVFQAQLGAPCLSFDIVRDTLGEERTDVSIHHIRLLTTLLTIQFPMTLCLVAGSQAAAGKHNHVTLVKMSQLIKTHKEDKTNDSDDSSES